MCTFVSLSSLAIIYADEYARKYEMYRSLQYNYDKSRSRELAEQDANALVRVVSGRFDKECDSMRCCATRR